MDRGLGDAEDYVVSGPFRATALSPDLWLGRRRYIFSADVARALHEVHTIAPLKFMPNEDATFGFWVMGLDLRRIDHPKVRTAPPPRSYAPW